MRAAAGDRLVVRSRHLDGPVRDAEILEVRREDGQPPYRVRWSDTGHEGLVFPGPDAYVQHFGDRSDRSDPGLPRRRDQRRVPCDACSNPGGS